MAAATSDSVPTAYDALALTLDVPVERLRRAWGVIGHLQSVADSYRLTNDDVAGLARDLHTAQSFRWWVIDIASPMLLKWMSKSWGKRVDAGNAPFRFAPEEGTKLFEPYGWREEQFRSSWLESKRLNRQMRGAWLWGLIGKLRSRAKQEALNRFSGIVLLQRT